MKKGKLVLYAGVAVVLATTMTGYGVMLQKDTQVNHCNELCPITQVQLQLLDDETATRHQIRAINNELRTHAGVSCVPGVGVEIRTLQMGEEVETTVYMDAIVEYKDGKTIYTAPDGYELVGKKCKKTVVESQLNLITKTLHFDGKVTTETRVMGNSIVETEPEKTKTKK